MDSRKVYEDALRTWGAEAQTKMLFIARLAKRLEAAHAGVGAGE